MVFLLSVVGNSLVIFVVRKCPELRKTVNYFTVNMAVSDFISPLIAIPSAYGGKVARSLEWPIGGTVGLMVYSVKSFLTSVSLTVSMQSLVWITFDRFVAVVWLTKVRLISLGSRSFAIASSLGCVGTIILPRFVLF